MSLSPLTLSIRRPANLSQHVYDAVTKSIATGGLEPGVRLVVERVAQELGVSPTPVREALGRLINEGLVMETGTGRFMVMPLTPAYVSDTFLVRGALEGLAAELAAARVSDARISELAVDLDEADAALRLGVTDPYSRFDDSLHRSIFEAGGNAVLLRELGPLQIHVDFIRHYSRHVAGEHITLSQAEHRVILEALRSRDARRSRQAMETHIRNAGQRIGRLIDFHSPNGGGGADNPRTLE